MFVFQNAPMLQKKPEEAQQEQTYQQQAQTAINMLVEGTKLLQAAKTPEQFREANAKLTVSLQSLEKLNNPGVPGDFKAKYIVPNMSAAAQNLYSLGVGCYNAAVEAINYMEQNGASMEKRQERSSYASIAYDVFSTLNGTYYSGLETMVSDTQSWMKAPISQK